MQPLPSPLDAQHSPRRRLVREPWREDLLGECASRAPTVGARDGLWVFADRSCWRTPAKYEPALALALAGSIEVRLASQRAPELAASLAGRLPTAPASAPWEMQPWVWREIAACTGPPRSWPLPVAPAVASYQRRRRLHILRTESAARREAGLSRPQEPTARDCATCGCRCATICSSPCGCAVCGDCGEIWSKLGGPGGCPAC